MQSIEELQISQDISAILKEVSSIAVVGLSPKENRPSHMVARYLIDVGYTVYPVNPGHDEILGFPCYPHLKAVPYPIDLVDIFRRSEDILPIVETVLELERLPKAIWMQQGIVNEEAATLAREQKLSVIMDRCIKIDHANLIQ